MPLHSSASVLTPYGIDGAIKNESTGATLLNNIVLSRHPWRGSISVTLDSLPGLTSDHNVVMERFTLDDSGSVIDLTAWRQATGQDLHSLVSTPEALFVDSSAADYHLRADAPARDAAPTLAGVATDLEGTPRPVGPAADIGADEHGEGAPPPPPPPAPADLVEIAVWSPPATIARGRGFTVSDTVRNQGGTTAPASRTRYFLSKDGAKSDTDRALTGVRAVPALPAGTESRGAVTVNVPKTLAPGTYVLLACADHRQVVAEGDETNNRSAAPSPVQVTR